MPPGGPRTRHRPDGRVVRGGRRLQKVQDVGERRLDDAVGLAGRPVRQQRASGLVLGRQGLDHVLPQGKAEGQHPAGPGARSRRPPREAAPAPDLRAAGPGSKGGTAAGARDPDTALASSGSCMGSTGGRIRRGSVGSGPAAAGRVAGGGGQMQEESGGASPYHRRAVYPPPPWPATLQSGRGPRAGCPLPPPPGRSGPAPPPPPRAPAACGIHP